ncbi:MAG: NAD-binding protein [Victivallales bacterium]|nr:NAD-binding protein [Victivallales bacterium]
MKILIIGAGELGQMLADKLRSLKANDVTVVDTSEEELQTIQDNLDIMTVPGDATNIAIMKQAGIEKADILLAVSGDQASNMLACQLGKKFGVKECICRVYSNDAFSEADGITPEFYGIDKSFSSPVETLRHLLYILRHQLVIEHVEFSNPDATMVTVVIDEDSPLKNLKLQDIPDKDLLAHIRFAALVHYRKISFPHGDTTIREGDKVYIAGRQDYVERFLQYASGDKDRHRKLVIIGGANRMADVLAHALIDDGMEVRIISPTKEGGERLLTKLPEGTRVLAGSTTDQATLEEAGIKECDVYINTEQNDENTILSCILAKRIGCRKVVAVTHKPEYISIVPTMSVIDCGFNSTITSVNTVFRLLQLGNYNIDTRLRLHNADYTEFTIGPKCNLANRLLKDCGIPKNAVLAMIFRGNEVIAPSGTTKFQEGDVIAAIVTPESEKELKPLFP